MGEAATVQLKYGEVGMLSSTWGQTFGFSKDSDIFRDQVLPRLVPDSPESEADGSAHGSSEEGSFHGSSDAGDSLHGRTGSSLLSSSPMDGHPGIMSLKTMLFVDDVEGPKSSFDGPSQVDIPVYVMLPLHTVSTTGVLQNPSRLLEDLTKLKTTGITGVMIDVWWGIVERYGPREYDWTAYQELVKLLKQVKLKLQAVMSFHACGGNANDNYTVSLPQWVLDIGNQKEDLFYTDRSTFRNRECLSLWADEEPVLAGRTPIQVYTDFMEGFREAMGDDFGEVVTEVAVGMGPCGELRYPSYPGGERWVFPGIGEFQCYDAWALNDLARAAAEAGRPDWGNGGPHDAGTYNSSPQDTGFFRGRDGSMDTAYGHFFLEWYSSSLVKHGERMLQAACKAFYGIEPSQWADEAALRGRNSFKRVRTPREVHLSLKCAGVHWWYKSKSHAAELTAGYYNVRGRDGYLPIMELCRKYGADFNFTCVEMRDAEQPSEARCSPEGLLKQVRLSAANAGVPTSGENALPRLDAQAYDVIVSNTCCTVLDTEDLDADGRPLGSTTHHHVPPMTSLTFLRLSPELLRETNFGRFHGFVRRMQDEGQIANARRSPRYLHLHSTFHSRSFHSPRQRHYYSTSPRQFPTRTSSLEPRRWDLNQDPNGNSTVPTRAYR